MFIRTISFADSEGRVRTCTRILCIERKDLIEETAKVLAARTEQGKRELPLVFTSTVNTNALPEGPRPEFGPTIERITSTPSGFQEAEIKTIGDLLAPGGRPVPLWRAGKPGERKRWSTRKSPRIGGGLIDQDTRKSQPLTRAEFSGGAPLNSVAERIARSRSAACYPETE